MRILAEEAGADIHIPSRFREPATLRRRQPPAWLEMPQNPCINQNALDNVSSTLGKGPIGIEKMSKLRQSVKAKFQCLELTKTSGILKCTCDEPTNVSQS